MTEALSEFAAEYFRLSKPVKGSQSPLKDHLDAIERQTGRAQYELPEFPLGMECAWNAWLDLQGSRESGWGVSPITYREIESYVNLTGVLLRPFEIAAIKRVDSEYRRIFSG